MHIRDVLGRTQREPSDLPDHSMLLVMRRRAAYVYFGDDEGITETSAPVERAQQTGLCRGRSSDEEKLSEPITPRVPTPTGRAYAAAPQNR